MAVFHLDPLADRRWSELVHRHASATVFHTIGWLKALSSSYGFRPIAFTTSPAEAALANGVVFAEIRSWLTGARLVSLPFSDHCEPLGTDGDALTEIVAYLARERTANGWAYVEIRPLQVRPESGNGLHPSASHWLHSLDLQAGAGRVFQSFHKDSIQRKIRRAEREGVVCETGRSEPLLREFYGLLVKTRRRHRLPPQPFPWFANLVSSLGESVTVFVARHRGRPIAAIVTLSHGGTLVYKYGASDEGFHALGGMPFLFWTAIQDACARGCKTLDFGRSDSDNIGLLTFKDRLGAHRSRLTYWRQPAAAAESRLRAFLGARARGALALAPEPICLAAGRLLYKHVG